MSNYVDHMHGSIEDDVSRRQFIMMRLRVLPGHTLPFVHVSTAIVGDEIQVWVVALGDNQSHILRDDIEKFPSDRLITQLKILSKK